MSIHEDIMPLYEAFGSPDEELFRKVMSSQCSRCFHAGHEDDLYTTLIAFFRMFTGATFIRAYENGSRPPHDSIYGTVFIQSYEFETPVNRSAAFIVEGENKICESVLQTCRARVQVSAYREQGTSPATQDGENNSINNVYSASDLLMKVSQRLKHRAALQLLWRAGVSIKSLSKIGNAPIETNSTYEQRAVQTFDVCFCKADTIQGLSQMTAGELIFCEEVK